MRAEKNGVQVLTTERVVAGKPAFVSTVSKDAVVLQTKVYFNAAAALSGHAKLTELYIDELA